MTNLVTLGKVEGLGRVVESSNDNFYDSLKLLRESSSIPISPRDEAYARLVTRGKKRGAIGSFHPTWTSAGIEYIKNQLPILRLDSRLNNPEFAGRAAEANRQGVYFSTPTEKEYEESLKQAEEDLRKNPKDRSVIILPSRTSFMVGPKKNGDIYETLFRDMATPYLSLLMNDSHTFFFPVGSAIVDSQEGTILDQLWFGPIFNCHSFYGGSKSLHEGYKTRGVVKTRSD